MNVVRHIMGLIAAATLAVCGSGCEERGAKPLPPAAAEQHSEIQSPSVSAQRIETELSAADEYLRADDVRNAQIILARLIERAPRDLRARELYGQALTAAAIQAQKRNDLIAAGTFRRQAYEQYAIAVEIDPNSAGLHQSAAMMASAAENQTAALQHFQAAGRLEPDNPQYPLFEAQILIQQRAFDAASASLRRVLTIDPTEALAHASLAIIALEQNQFDDALKHIAEARRIAPQDIGLRAQHARIVRRQGNPTRALELLVGLSANERAQELIATELAACYEQLGDHLQAARVWQHCYKTDQLNAKAYLWAVRAGEALLEAGEREQASLWLQQAQVAAPTAPEVQALEAAMRE